MVIDTNGHELEVFESWDFSHTIQYILFRSRNMEETRLNECECILKKNNYSFVDSVLIDNLSFDVYKQEPSTTCTVM